MGADDLQVRSRRDGEVGILAVGGEVRLEIAPRLRAAGETLLREGARDLVVDLSQVLFMDSASLSALIHLDRQASEAGGRIVLCRASPAVELVLENSGLDRRFAVTADEAAARALLAGD